MAKENIAKFFDAAMTDKALAEKLAALAAESGYDFTAAELLELGTIRPLSDGDVRKASGGVRGDSNDMEYHDADRELREMLAFINRRR